MIAIIRKAQSLSFLFGDAKEIKQDRCYQGKTIPQCLNSRLLIPIPPSEKKFCMKKDRISHESNQPSLLPP